MIMRELRAVRDGMKGLAFDDPRYPALRARENIIHQFETITYHQLVHLNPWSFDSVVNGMDNVIVLFYTSWCVECRDMIKDMAGEAVRVLRVGRTGQGAEGGCGTGRDRRSDLRGLLREGRVEA